MPWSFFLFDVESILHPLRSEMSVETGSDVLPVATAVTGDYSPPQEYEESPIHPVLVGPLSVPESPRMHRTSM